MDASIQNYNVLPLILNFIYSMVNLLSKHQIHHVLPQILYLEINFQPRMLIWKPIIT